MTTQKLSIPGKVGYGLGDGASNIIWQTIMLFMAYFYTDVYGLDAFHMGTMFLFVRVFDALFDIFIGSLADRTRHRLGQFRPYLLWFALPFGICGALTFYTPAIGDTGKIIYAWVSYTALSMLYTLVNVPYCAMINNLSGDPVERVSMQSYRFACAALGGVVVSSVAMPLTHVLGGDNLQRGYFYAMIIMGSISTVLFLMCFFMTRETRIPPVDMQASSMKSVMSDLAILAKDKNWLSLFTLNVVNLVAGILKTGGAIYFVNYYINRPDLVSVILTIILGAKFIGSLLTPIVYKNLDRVFAYKLAMCVQAIIMIGLFFVGAQHVWAICLLIGVIHLINSSATPLQWSMLSDIIDDLEKRMGRSLSGLVFSTNLFAIKVGIAIGGATIGWMLTWGGYVGKAPHQAEDAVLVIRLIFTVIPALLILSLIFILRNYSLHDKPPALHAEPADAVKA